MFDVFSRSRGYQKKKKKEKTLKRETRAHTEADVRLHARAFAAPSVKGRGIGRKEGGREGRAKRKQVPLARWSNLGGTCARKGKKSQKKRKKKGGKDSHTSP